MVTDVMQAVSYLRGRKEVDPRRIAAAGYSMGSFVLALAGAVETRLRACVLVGGGNLDGPEGYWDRAKPMCQGTPYRALAFLGDRPAVLYSLHASRGPTLLCNGREDVTVSIPTIGEDHLREVRARAARRGGRTLRSGICGRSRPPALLRYQARCALAGKQTRPAALGREVHPRPGGDAYRAVGGRPRGGTRPPLRHRTPGGRNTGLGLRGSGPSAGGPQRAEPGGVGTRKGKLHPRELAPRGQEAAGPFPLSSTAASTPCVSTASCS